MSTPEQRAEWRRLEQAAPCTKCHNGQTARHLPGMIHYETDSGDEMCPSYHWETVSCDCLLAVARTAVPALLDDVERLELELDRKEGLCEIQHRAIGALNDDVERLKAENAQLRAELRRWLEEIARTTPWEMEEPLMKFVTIQVDKKDYEEARARMKDLEERA